MRASLLIPRLVIPWIAISAGVGMAFQDSQVRPKPDATFSFTNIAREAGLDARDCVRR